MIHFCDGPSAEEERAFDKAVGETGGLDVLIRDLHGRLTRTADAMAEFRESIRPKKETWEFEFNR